MSLLHSAAILLAANISKTAASPPAPPTDSSEILVQGTRDRDKQIRDFVKDLTPAPVRGQLARFELPVCPLVLGIADAQASLMEDRMRTIAKAVGLDVAKRGCKVNMAVFVAPNKAALLTELEHWPLVFPEEWSQSTINQLKRDPSPVAAWHTEQFVWLDGAEVSAADTTANVPDPAGGTHLRFPHAVATRIRPSARPIFRKSVVVIQSDAIAGLTPIELADYAVMRSLIRADPKDLRASSPGTILSIIDAPMGTAVPESLTPWDLTFLKSFYASTKNMYAEYQRAQMKGEMRRELDRQQQMEGKQP